MSEDIDAEIDRQCEELYNAFNIAIGQYIQYLTANDRVLEGNAVAGAIVGVQVSLLSTIPDPKRRQKLRQAMNHKLNRNLPIVLEQHLAGMKPEGPMQ